MTCEWECCVPLGRCGCGNSSHCVHRQDISRLFNLTSGLGVLLISSYLSVFVVFQTMHQWARAWWVACSSPAPLSTCRCWHTSANTSSASCLMSSSRGRSAPLFSATVFLHFTMAEADPQLIIKKRLAEELDRLFKLFDPYLFFVWCISCRLI